MKILEPIIELLGIPILILNVIGGIVGGIWLGFLGQWGLIGIGIILVFTSHFYLSILLLPGVGLSFLALYFYKNQSPLRHLFAFLYQLFTNVLIVGSCGLAFWICTRYYEGATSLSLIPYLLWSWGMALGPWRFFVSKEPDNEFSGMTVFVASVLYLVFLISIFLGPWFVLIAIVLFGIVQLVIFPVFLMYIASQMEKEEKEYSY